MRDTSETYKLPSRQATPTGDSAPGQHMDPGGTTGVDLSAPRTGCLAAAHIHHATPGQKSPRAIPRALGT